MNRHDRRKLEALHRQMLNEGACQPRLTKGHCSIKIGRQDGNLILALETEADMYTWPLAAAQGLADGLRQAAAGDPSPTCANGQVFIPFGTDVIGLTDDDMRELEARARANPAKVVVIAPQHSFVQTPASALTMAGSIEQALRELAAA
jgi:hypothetical protein